MSEIVIIFLGMLAVYGALSLARDVLVIVGLERARRRGLRAVDRWEELNGRRP